MERRLHQPRAERRRDEALRATLGLLRRGGPAAVTLRAVAADSGVPLGSLTYYFTDKEELLYQAMVLWTDEELEKVAALAESIEAESLSPAEAAERCAAMLEGYDPEQIAQYELYLHAARVPAMRQAVETAFRAYDRAVASVLAAAGAHEPERVAPLFVALADGLGLRRVAAPGESPDLAQALLALFEAVSRARGGDRPHYSA